MLSMIAGRSARRSASGSLWCCLIVVAAVLGGCASPQKKEDTEKPPQTIWPAPPDPARFRFVTMLRKLSDIRPETEDERLRRALTGQGVGDEMAYGKPTALAAKGGRIYVTDPESSAVVVFDVPRRRVFRFGTREPHTVQRPNAVALDDEGRAYVLDTKRKRVMVFDALGLFIREMGSDDDYAKPVGLAVSSSGDRVYVVDRGSLNGADHKVVVYDGEGDKIRDMGPRGKGEGQFDIPLDAAIAPDDSLVVLDAGNFRVQVFDKSGNFVRAFGSVGNGVGQFARPRGIAVDPDGNIYVSDASFNNVQVFSPQGEMLMSIGGSEMRGGPGEYALVGPLAADDDHYVYVADMFFRKIEVYQRLTPK